MSFEIKGNLIVKEAEQEISASFKKREFVIEVINETNTDWNDFIKFQLTQDRCDRIDNINIGDEINVNFNIRGRKWEKDGKTNYFSNLEAWRIEPISRAANPEPESTQNTDNQEDTDDLPF